jgi:hypothetical protein
MHKFYQIYELEVVFYQRSLSYKGFIKDDLLHCKIFYEISLSMICSSVIQALKEVAISAGSDRWGQERVANETLVKAVQKLNHILKASIGYGLTTVLKQPSGST